MSYNIQRIEKRGFFYDSHYTFGKFMLQRYTSSIVNSSAV